MSVSAFVVIFNSGRSTVIACSEHLLISVVTCRLKHEPDLSQWVACSKRRLSVYDPNATPHQTPKMAFLVSCLNVDSKESIYTKYLRWDNLRWTVRKRHRSTVPCQFARIPPSSFLLESEIWTGVNHYTWHKSRRKKTLGYEFEER